MKQVEPVLQPFGQHPFGLYRRSFIGYNDPTAMTNQHIAPQIISPKPFISLISHGPVQLGFTRHNQDLSFLVQQLPQRQTIELKQIHGNIIRPASSDSVGLDGDGLISRDRRFIPVIRTADCIPLFFWHKNLPFFGILHIGWRGFVSMIQRKLLEKIVLCDLETKDFSFYIGPAICSLHYPVGEEVIREFAPLVLVSDIAQRQSDGRFLLDLKKALKMDLSAQGIHENQIGDANLCTFASSDLPSYRRQKNGERIYNFITWG